MFESIGIHENPFEHYAAETEPNIAEYAIRPPYLTTISNRVKKLNSFILFGDRGAGKSATRLTIYSEMWADKSFKENENRPFTVHYTDFTKIIGKLSNGSLRDSDLISQIAYVTMEQVLVWLSSLEDDQRTVYIEGLESDERALIVALLEGFYLNEPKNSRMLSTDAALKLLNAAWATKSKLWANQRWTALSSIVSKVTGSLASKKLGSDVDLTEPVDQILNSLKSSDLNATSAVLGKLVEIVRMFGFSGLCILVDKVDETPVTDRSAEDSAKLVYPVLRHIQLLEVEGCSWVFFLWSNMQSLFNDKFSVRLDKISHTTIMWDKIRLRDMIDSRVNFYAEGEAAFSDLCDEGQDVDDLFDILARHSVGSPRELVKLLDTIVREHVARGDTGLLNNSTVSLGIDKYVAETVETWYPVKQLKQLYRLGRKEFNNTDVQNKFKIGQQGARVKIKQWEDFGMVMLDGTMPSDKGHKPVHKYVISDPRISRIIRKGLSDIVGADEALDD